MAIQTVQASALNLRIQNLTNDRVNVLKVSVPGGGHRTAPITRINHYDRAVEVADLVHLGVIQVTLDTLEYGYQQAPLSELQIKSLASPSATPYGTSPAYADATRPNPADVPVGFTIFNTDDNFINCSDGTNWRDPTGAIT